jgi:hypothetical protein
MAKRRASGVANKSSDQRPTSREVIAFIEKFLRIPDGPSAGQPLILAPWQKQEFLQYGGGIGERRGVRDRRSRSDQRLRSTLADSLMATACRRSEFHRIIFRAASKVSAAWSRLIAD